MFLLDTCVISEAMRLRPEPAVVKWMNFQNPLTLFISVLTLGEMYYGLAQLRNVSRERELSAWIADVERRFANRIVVLDDLASRQWGYLRAAYPKAQTADAQIAAIALAHSFRFVTRNVKHFRFEGLDLLNPWEASWPSPRRPNA